MCVKRRPQMMYKDVAGWSMSCAARGLCRLPGVFVAPTQALLLAALAPADSDDDVLHDTDAVLPDIEQLLSAAS